MTNIQPLALQLRVKLPNQHHQNKLANIAALSDQINALDNFLPPNYYQITPFALTSSIYEPLNYFSIPQSPRSNKT